MRRFLLHFLVTAGALVVADWALGGVRIRSTSALLIGALVLGLVNALVRPLLVLLTLPITIVTLGLFYFVVNGLSFALAAWLVPGFGVTSLTAAMLGALIVSLVSWIAGGLTRRAQLA